MRRISSAAVLILLGCAARGQTVVETLDDKEVAGERPYEMVWARRVEPAAPTLRFDRLDGWKTEVQGGAETVLQISRAQNIWDRPVSKLRYRGDGKSSSKPRVLIVPLSPVAVPADADSVDLWIFGNRWDWENPPDTPPLRIVLSLRDGDEKQHDVPVGNIRWKEWWLIHKKLPGGLKPPVRLESISADGGWQAAWREIFFDSIRFYREELPPLKFAERPKRNLQLLKGQSAGANTGPGKLSFPTREQTILPQHLGGKFRNSVREQRGDFVFEYRREDCSISYHFAAANGLSGLVARVGQEPGFALLDGAAVRFTKANTNAVLKSARLDNGVVTAEYSNGTILRLRIWQKSLVLDVINRSGQATELALGQISGVQEPRTISIPFLNYGGGAHPCVLLSRAGTNALFTSVWLDWYRSNGSELYALEAATNHVARINGGVRYQPRTDGTRNPMFERLFLTVSPTFEEVLPVVSNPVGLHAQEAVDRLWQESWGPQDYEKEMQRSRVLRAYGIEKLIQCNHEIAWRDGGESFTLRTRAAPKKGGDAALQQYVAHQRGLGWLAGLYSNYTDYAPVNEFWSPDGVQRQPDGNWRTAWPRCYAEKPLKAVEFDHLLAPQLKKKFNPTSAYTDVQTAVAPWHYNDFDARVPGAGTLAQTFFAFGELLRNDSRVYGGPIFSEGTYHWLYAGLADGNYALAYDGRPLAKEPLLPVFDLLQIHTKECDIGMGWTANFCDAVPNWKTPGNIDGAIDRFLLHTLAYGHIGWLVEEGHGIARTCRSYYMLQQVQARYGLKAPARIAYWDGGRLVSVSEALVRDLPRTQRQLFVEYPGGLQLWFNDHPKENWRAANAERGTRNAELVLPPAGWAAKTKNGELISYSALNGTNRVDYIRSPEYVYLDGRGRNFDAPEASSDGALAIRARGRGELEIIHISGHSAFVIRRPFKVGGSCVTCDAFDEDGHRIPSVNWHDAKSETRIELAPKAIRYVLHFKKN